VHQLKSERVAYEYMLGRFKETGNSRLARRLEAAPVSLTGGIPDAYLAMRDKAMHRLGVGTTHDMKSVLSGVIWPSLRSPQYTLSEKTRMWRGKLSCGVSALWDEMLATDLAETVTELALPAYFFHGIYDYTVSYQLAKEIFSKAEGTAEGVLYV
jgi:hypothetical protein